MTAVRHALAVLSLLSLALLEAAAQQPARIAWLGSGSEAGSAAFMAEFRQGLKENGLIEGRDYVVDARYADNRYERFPALVQDLLQRDPAVIMVVTIASVRAAQRATTTIPIVMISTNDPVKYGLVASLAHPGGNTTGLGTMQEDLVTKYVQLLRDLRPGARRLAVLVNPDNPSNVALSERLRASTHDLGVVVRAVKLTGADDLEAAFETMARDPPDAVAVAGDLSFFDRHIRICSFATKYRIPTFGHTPEFAEAGCLAGFGASRRALYRRSASYVKKILDGANPGDLPVEMPMRVELAVNLKAARELGLKVPKSLLLRADRVIE